MKPLILLSFTFALSGLGMQHLMAQSGKQDRNIREEKIIVEGKDGKPSTTIEIRDGEVFIDGRKIEKDEAESNAPRVQRKIIINGKDVSDDPAYRDWPVPFGDFDMNLQGKPMLGVNTKATTHNDGAEVESVVPGSPAEKFGLKAGDVITRVDKQNIYTPKDLVDAIGAHKPGEAVDITFERNNEFTTKHVTLSERKDNMAFRGTVPLGDEDLFRNFERMFGGPMRGGEWNSELRRPGSGSAPKIGVSVEDRADGEGVLVNSVTDNSAAAKAGIQQGDVITRYGSSAISEVDDLVEAIAAQQNKTSVDVEVKRAGQTKSLNLSVPKNLKKKDL